MRKLSAAAVTKNTKAMAAPMTLNAMQLVEALQKKIDDSSGGEDNES
jgi:hypothetical protein